MRFFLKVWPFCLSKTEYIIFKGGERGCKDLEVESLFFKSLFIAMNCTKLNCKIDCKKKNMPSPFKL